MTHIQNQSQKPFDEHSPEIELLKKRISGWLRQSRYRGRKSGVDVDISFQDVVDIYEESEYRCIYCGEMADSPDHPFPIKEHGPCVPANVVPCCNCCRNKKKNRNLIQFYKDGCIAQPQWHALMKKMVKRKGGDKLREYLRTTYGIGNEPKSDHPT
jgi:hypothetical protein